MKKEKCRHTQKEHDHVLETAAAREELTDVLSEKRQRKKKKKKKQRQQKRK